MGPGATKINFFEAPSLGDAEHHVLNTGPLRVGLSCQGSPGGEGEIKRTLFLGIPGPTTSLSTMPTGEIEPGKPEEPEYETIGGSIADIPSELVVKEKESKSASEVIIIAGPDGVPLWLSINYGANTVATSNSSEGLTSGRPRGCWMLIEEV